MDGREEALRIERQLNALLSIHRQLAELLVFVNRIGDSLEALSISTLQYIREQNLQPRYYASAAEDKSVGQTDAEKWAQRRGER